MDNLIDIKNIQKLIYNNIYNNNDIQPIQLSKYIAQNYGSFNQTELNMVDMYWNTTFNKGWIYFSNDMIENIFSYTLLKFIVLTCAILLA